MSYIEFKLTPGELDVPQQRGYPREGVHPSILRTRLWIMLPKVHSSFPTKEGKDKKSFSMGKHFQLDVPGALLDQVLP